MIDVTFSADDAGRVLVVYAVQARSSELLCRRGNLRTDQNGQPVPRPLAGGLTHCWSRLQPNHNPSHHRSKSAHAGTSSFAPFHGLDVETETVPATITRRAKSSAPSTAVFAVGDFASHPSKLASGHTECARSSQSRWITRRQACFSSGGDPGCATCQPKGGPG